MRPTGSTRPPARHRRQRGRRPARAVGLLVALAATLTLGAAPSALAQAGPTVLGPADGATFTSGDAITFTASDTTPVANPRLYVHISQSSTPDSFGVIGWDVWFGELTGGGLSWSKSYTGTALSPGTYFWQIYRTDDTPCFPDCYYEAEVRTLTITAAPSPSLTAPSDLASFTAGDPITFTAHDAAAGASLTLSVSTSSVTDGAGVIGHEALSAGMTGGPDFSHGWTGSGALSPGTYYWQVHRADCVTQPDCKVESTVRRFTLAAPPPPAAGPPSPVSPPDGATFRVGDPITFTAGDGAGQSVYVRVSKSTARDSEGLIGSDVTISSMGGGPTYSTTWTYSSLQSPGTYYWQAYRIDCSTPSYPDCRIESTVRSFQLVAATVPTYPAPASLSPADGASFRAGVPITFSVADSAPSPRTYLLISGSALKDGDGLLDGSKARQRLTGATPFSLAWTGTENMPKGGTLYWQAYRDDCPSTTSTGCRRGGPVRRLRILASTARISVRSACYREGSSIRVTGSGFTRYARVDVGFLGERKVTRTVSRTGTVVALVKAPGQPDTPGSRLESLSAEERGNGANEPRRRVRVAAIAMSVSPATIVRSGQRVRFTFSGFPTGRPLYAHYRLGGRTRGHQRLGTVRGSCGNLSARGQLVPSAIARSGAWTVQFDARSTYSARTRPRLVRHVRVWTARTRSVAAVGG